MKIGDLVYIKWEDSLGCAQGWVQLHDYRGVKVSEVESVGWVSAVTKRGVQLVPHLVVKNADCAMGMLTIPRSAILAKKVIEKVFSSKGPAPNRKQR